MIAYLEGKFAEIEPTHAIIDVHGIGYIIRISLNTYSIIKELDNCRLHTYLHIKEDAHTLFGFWDPKEKEIFLDLLGISGVGPSTCMLLLSSLTPEEVQHAIGSEDLKLIQSIKGIGTKTAQRIILELGDKMRKGEMVEKTGEISLNSYNTMKNEALSAVTTLGLNRGLAEKRIDAILKQEPNISLEDLIKLILKTG